MPRKKDPDKPAKLPEDPELLEKEAQALSMHTKGMKWDDIAESLGYSNASGAWKAAQRALARYPSATVDEARAVQNAQLDELIRQSTLIYEHALDMDDYDTALKAQDRIGKWLDRRAKLNGLDAPVRTEVDMKGAAFQTVAIPASRLPEKAQQRLARESAENAAKGDD